MAKGVSKAKRTKAFLRRGDLAGQIKQRHEARAFKQKVKGREVRRNKGGVVQVPAEVDSENEEVIVDGKIHKKKGEQSDSDDDDDEEEEEEMNVDQLLEGDGIDDDDSASDDDLAGLASDDEPPMTHEQHMADLQALAERDPDFFKYLQENDAELLDFDPNAAGEADDSEDESEGEEESEDDESEDEGKGKKGKGKEKEKVDKPTPVLTSEIIKKWQRSLLETKSIRALRKLLLAFRSVAQSGLSGDAGARWSIQSPAVYNKLIVTSLKFTPVVLAKHVPFKATAGKFKLAPKNAAATATVQRLIKSYFVSLQSLLETVSAESGIPALAVTESAKLVPWVVGNRKVARGWVKMLLGLYEAGADEVRLAAFVALRKLAVAADHGLRESVIKGIYAGVLGCSKQNSVYTLPSLTLMKNAGSEMFLLPGKAEGEMAYQLTFGYIRQLAILLRKGVKQGTKDAFKAVYNWQFVHAIDFWSLVLSASCDKEHVAEKGESALQQLVYPLIQVALGAIRLVPTSRYYPFRFHLIRSLLRITQRTGTYIPLATPLFEVLASPDLSRSSKASSLRPLDFAYYLKCPAAYQKTRVYADALGEEAMYLLAECFGALATSIAFPELALPAVVALKRHGKKKYQARLGAMVKVLVEKLEAQAKWVEARREKVEFAPQRRDKVDRFLQGEPVEGTPLGGHLRLVRKLRDQRRETLEKAAQGDEL